MELNQIMDELMSLGSERTKTVYISNGAQEPVFGVTISAMKPIFKKIKYNQPLAEQLYATGNYDAMYLAGMIAEPKKKTEEDFNRWIEGAYFYMISGYIVAVTLAETNIAFTVADRWIDSGKELTCRQVGVASIGYQVLVKTSPSTLKEYDFVSGFFAPSVGVNEDPVTGLAHCCLAPYWKKRLNKNQFIARQVSERGGILTVSLEDVRVYIGGQAVTVLKAELFC